MITAIMPRCLGLQAQSPIQPACPRTIQPDTAGGSWPPSDDVLRCIKRLGSSTSALLSLGGGEGAHELHGGYRTSTSQLWCAVPFTGHDSRIHACKREKVNSMRKSPVT
jgi:hypothetical protein